MQNHVLPSFLVTRTTGLGFQVTTYRHYTLDLTQDSHVHSLLDVYTSSPRCAIDSRMHPDNGSTSGILSSPEGKCLKNLLIQEGDICASVYHKFCWSFTDIYCDVPGQPRRMLLNLPLLRLVALYVFTTAGITGLHPVGLHFLQVLCQPLAAVSFWQAYSSVAVTISFYLVLLVLSSGLCSPG